MKCGRYEIDCTAFLNGWFRSSFNSNARMTGAGNPKTIFSRLMITVLRSTRAKKGSRNRSLKCWKLFQGLPRMPSPTRKSLKAMTTPQIGR